MPSVSANGIKIEYESFGAESAPAIVLIMGLGMQMIAWPDPFCQKLAAAGFRVIRFDNRDIGLSTHFDDRGVPNMIWAFLKARIGLKVRGPYDLNDMAADTVGLLDALKVGKAHVVGASMGGMIAQQVSAKYPERVRSLVSIMSTSGDRRLPPATRDAQRALFARPANPHDQNSIVEHSMKIWDVIGSPGFPTDPAELRARTQRAVARSYHPQGVARQLVGILASGDRSKDLATIRTPTLVIHGDCDPLVRPACGEDTARKIPGARLRVIKGMGHDMAAWPVLADEILGHVRAVGP
jgi:pimeloyl-ACP methyl ester carboxylesterase